VNRIVSLVCALGLMLGASASASAAGDKPAAAKGGEMAGPSTAVTAEILDAVASEIERAMGQMRIPGEPPPYLISHKLTEIEVNDVVASLGATTWKRDRHFVLIEARVQVGDYALDNSNFVIANAEGTDGTAQYVLPMEATPRIARRAAWLVTDAAYKEALEQFRAKRDTRRATGAFGQDRPSYSKQPPLVREESVPVPALEPLSRLEEIAQAASAVFRDVANIRDSRVAFTSFIERRWYINSEGTSAHDTRRVSGVIISATSQAEDGQELSHYFSRYGHTLTDLPSRDTLVREARELGRELNALRAAPVVSNYTGPVLFEGAGAAGMVRHTLAPHLGGTPLPEGLSADEAKQFGGALAGRVGLRVTSPLLSLVDDPTAQEVKIGGKTRALIGGYALDDEGVPAQRVEVIDDGTLEALLTTRTPSKAGETSNGHARRTTAGGVFHGSATNLFVTGKRGLAPAQLKRRLLAEARDQGLDYALVIRRFDDPAVSATPELTMRELLHLYTTTDKQMPPATMIAHRVYLDGREELVRGVQLRSTPIRAWRDVIAVGRAPSVFNFLASADHHLVQRLNGVVNGEVPSSGIESAVITPDLLFKELDVVANLSGQREPALVPPPKAQ